LGRKPDSRGNNISKKPGGSKSRLVERNATFKEETGVTRGTLGSGGRRQFSRPISKKSKKS